MNRNAITMLNALLGLSVLTASAQLGPGQGRDGHGAGTPARAAECTQERQNGQQLPPAVADLLDWNHDGVISGKEINSAGEIVRKLDANRDGQVSREEICPAQPVPKGQMQGRGRGQGKGSGRGQGQAGPGGPPPHAGQGLLLNLLDTDGDGVLSSREISKAPAALRRCDANQDGAISGEEIRPGGVGGGGRGTGRGPGAGQP